jgi:hypothetical protein
VTWMLGVKDAGMMGEGRRAADWREGRIFAAIIVGDEDRLMGEEGLRVRS